VVEYDNDRGPPPVSRLRRGSCPLTVWYRSPSISLNLSLLLQPLAPVPCGAWQGQIFRTYPRTKGICLHQHPTSSSSSSSPLPAATLSL